MKCLVRDGQGMSEDLEDSSCRSFATCETDWQPCRSLWQLPGSPLWELYIYMCIYIYMYIYIYVNVCICNVHTYIYIYTYSSKDGKSWQFLTRTRWQLGADLGLRRGHCDWWRLGRVSWWIGGLLGRLDGNSAGENVTSIVQSSAMFQFKMFKQLWNDFLKFSLKVFQVLSFQCPFWGWRLPNMAVVSLSLSGWHLLDAKVKSEPKWYASTVQAERNLGHNDVIGTVELSVFLLMGGRFYMNWHLRYSLSPKAFGIIWHHLALNIRLVIREYSWQKYVLAAFESMKGRRVRLGVHPWFARKILADNHRGPENVRKPDRAFSCFLTQTNMSILLSMTEMRKTNIPSLQY